MNDIEIIAEIGVNHNGDIGTALMLMKAAKDAGCDTVKFQLWNSERVYPRERWEEMKKLELSADDLSRLKGLAEGMQLRFLCTPDDWQDLNALIEMGVERIKIGSSNITNKPLLYQLAKRGKPVLLSTGACEWGEMAAAIHALQPAKTTILHCVSAYPAPHDQLNLLVIRQIFRRFGQITVGFSDHTRTSQAALIAIGLGARIFEKHITLDTHQAGRDHAASCTPSLMASYVDTLRAASKSLGSGIKTLMPCEVENRAEYDRFVKHQYKHLTAS